MTNKYQDALNSLENIPFDDNGGVLADYETTFTIDENGDGFEFNVRKAFANLQELVDKETPVKPNLEGDGYWNGEKVYDIWICPNCGKEYEIDYDGKHNYCPQCGQSIDWSEDE